MTFRDRIIEFVRIPAGELAPNPRNWRTHSDQQQAALAGVLEEIGYAGALLARRLTDGRLELIDGHLRAATTPDQRVPVLVLDVSEAEADKLLATFDVITGKAGTDSAKLKALLARVEPSQPALRQLFDEMRSAIQREASGPATSDDDVDFEPAYQVLIECRDEAQQQTVFEELVASGLDCRLLML